MIFFDIDGTLLDHAAAERAGALALRERHPALAAMAPDRFVERWHALAEEYVDRFLAGELSTPEQRRARLRALFVEAGSSGEVVAGGWRQHSADAEKGYSDETTPGIQEGVWEFMQRAVPALQGKRVTHRWAGVMGFSGDGLPFIGDLPSKPRVKYLAGHTGHGFGFGFLAAKKLVDLALEGDPIGWLGAGRLTLQGA